MKSMSSRLAASVLAALTGAALTGAALTGAALTAPGAGAAETKVPRDISRLVAIGGSITEIVYALDAQGLLVARDSTSVFPDAARKLPDVGYMRQLSPESVLSVNPTAILALEGSGPVETMDVLEKADVPLVVVPETFTKDGILRKIRIVGAVLGKPAQAEKLAAAVEADIDAAEKPLAALKTRKRVLFILSMQGGKVLAAGKDTAADGIIAMAGAENAVTGYAGYKQLSDEAAIEARPDAILMMDRGGPGMPTEAEIFAQPGIAATPAGAARALIRMDGLYLLGFGPRTAGAIHDLSAALYPHAATD